MTATFPLLASRVSTTLDVADLDIDDLALDRDDDGAEIADGNGPLLRLTSVDDRDADQLFEVAEWWDKVADLAAELAEQYRSAGNAICEACNGAGGWSDDLSGRDSECRKCDGSGVIA